MELLVKIIIDFKGETIFAKRSILDVSQANFRCVTGSEFGSDYNKLNVFTNNKRAITKNGDSYYPDGILPVQSQ